MGFWNWFLGGEKNPPERAGYVPKEMDESWREHPSSPFTSFLYGVGLIRPQFPPAGTERLPKPLDPPECP